MPTVITLTQPSGSELLLATADLVYATNNGTVTTLTQENNQTNPQQIIVTEDLSEIVVLDDAFLTLTDETIGAILLNGLRIKSVEDTTDYRLVKYEGVGLVNREFKVSETISEIQDAINSTTEGSKIIASGEFNLKDLYESASLTIDITSFPDVGNPDTTVVKLDGVELFTIPTAFFADEAEFIDYLINATAGNPSYGYDGFIALGYPCSTTGVSLTINAPNGTGESYNGKIITIEKGAGGTCISPTNAEFTGGVDSGAENILTWIGDNTAANTAPTGVIVELTENDTYNGTFPETLGTGTVSIDGNAVNSGGGISAVLLKVDTTTISNIPLNPGETVVKADAIQALIANAQNGWQISNVGDVLTITEPVGQGGSFEGMQIIVENQVDVTFPTSGATEITGGAPVVNSDFGLQLDSDVIQTIGGAILNIISVLTYGYKAVVSPLQNTTLSSFTFSNSGDWSLPVTVGTVDDFRIKISILGERTD